MVSRLLEFHPEAEQEYLSALRWYRERSLTAAANFEGAIAEAIAKVEETPERWLRYFGEFRKYTIHQFPFSVVYQILSTHVLVLAIAHGHRRPGYWKNRSTKS
jgi:plasmid stabilization system protein ParE